MIKSYQVEAEFRKALDELLEKYDASLDIIDIGRDYTPIPAVEIFINAKYDDNDELTHEFAEFNIRG